MANAPQRQRFGIAVETPAFPFEAPQSIPVDLRAVKDQTQGKGVIGQPIPEAQPIGYGTPMSAELAYALQQFRSDLFEQLRAYWTPRIERRGYHQMQFINAGTAWAKARPQEDRTYFFIVNNDATNNMFLAYSQLDGSTGSLAIGPGGFYEPWVIPSNEIWVMGAAANVQGLLIIATPIPTAT